MRAVFCGHSFGGLERREAVRGNLEVLTLKRRRVRPLFRVPEKVQQGN